MRTDRDTKRFINGLILVALVAVLLHAFGQPGSAQSPTPSPSPSTTTVGTDEGEPHEIKPEPVRYVLPDLAPDVTTINTKAFSLRFGFVPLVDYTFNGQDDESRAQLGPQESVGDLRSGRFTFSGAFKFKKRWTYLVSVDINEKPTATSPAAFNVIDYNLTIPLWKKARITIGKQKEPFVYEMVGDAAYLPQQERILSPFFVSREVGIKYSDNFLNDRMSVSVGIYNTWEVRKVKFSEGGTQVAGRLTGLVLTTRDGREYLHVGGAYRYYGDDSGFVRFRGRNESNVNDNYVDTGNIKAKHANEMSLEALYSKGRYSVLTEYVHAWVNSAETRNPGFNGFYVTGSWVLTGEHRPYDRKAAYSRRMVPKSRWGAVEAVARYSYLDLDDSLVRGGRLNKVYFGMNWWASLQWKFGFGYGNSTLDRFNTVGHTKSLLLRAQWIY